MLQRSADFDSYTSKVPLTSAVLLLCALAVSLMLALKGERTHKNNAEIRMPYPSLTASVLTIHDAAVPRVWLQSNPKLRRNCRSEAK